MKPITNLLTVLFLLVLGFAQAFAWNPLTDVRDNLTWTLGEQASLGTAYKVAGSGDFSTGQRGDSVMFGIFDYRCFKESYGVIANPQNGERIGDGLKTGLMLNYFFGWFKSPQTPAMQLLQNINIGPAVTIPLFSDSHPFKFPSMWIEGNYQFGK